MGSPPKPGVKKEINGMISIFSSLEGIFSGERLETDEKEVRAAELYKGIKELVPRLLNN